MCGIAAVHDRRPTPERLEEGRAIGRRMLDALHHRGPDGRDDRQVGPTWLGHTRLSIVDLAGGRQPLTCEAVSGSRWVAANGEIYNHADLRARFAAEDGVAEDALFATHSDSEIVLHVLDRLGTDGLHRLKGMWAAAVADEDGGLVLGRDPLGVKPLYWAEHDDRLLVASEIQAFPAEARPRVEEFPPGHHWSSSDGLVPFADLRHDPLGDGAGIGPVFTTREEAHEAIRESVVESVRARMMADVPVGVFLSGGLDSSIVAAVMVRLAEPGQVIRSFAAGTPGSPDLVAAREVAAYLGTEHHERVYDDADVLEALPEVVRTIESYEPTLVRSAVPNHLLSALAAQHVKVVLTGEGADELFAGYHHLRDLEPEALADALVEGIEVLHHLNLQRADRTSMAHGLEARVPFLSRELLETAQRVPLAWKSLGQDHQARAQEKAILREAFEGWLPEHVLWRRKEQFGDGSGTGAVMARQAAAFVPEEEWGDVRFEGLPPARSREELGYQRVFAEHLGGTRAEQVLGRFATV
ncbi:asparagine synthase (glutamine-hydrolyzing) [Nocardioides bruguierae]|uniref:asparagine synthase (glutamine-hydrolyzing) n=1 Tax=Nocardioides bruguierae TaxID=2945102 RepID=A0A9X2IFQ1_9ACTN|nr:asparagine synthase (glutamine-hydrolyzing) [Nocardioides bruguierae]MCM0622071.1 asparagine synthase (glutamine-hydrolyzing) [Nocardioides bruguierae]